MSGDDGHDQRRPADDVATTRRQPQVTDLFETPTLPPAGSSRQSRSAARARAAAKRRRRRRRRSALVVVVALLVVGGAGYVIWDQSDSLLAFVNPVEAKDFPGPGGDQVQVEIAQGSNGAQMGQALVDAGVVGSVKAFTTAFDENPAAKSIQPGTYTMLSEMKASDAVALLAKNEKVETRLTIPEGYTRDQIVERAVSVTGITREDFDAALADPASFGLPAEAGGNAEGWLYPSTYVVQPSDTAASILSQMVTKTVAELDGLGVAPADRETVITKASIVEREAPSTHMAEVARVIENRLDKGVALGMDAIDAYGLGKPSNQITRSEFADPNLPYASRVHTGLPPTPIGSPGEAAVKAVLAPADGPWLWYVTVNLDTQETKFTDSYAEFEKFKKEFQDWQAANGG